MNTLSKKITPLFFKEDIRHDCYSEAKKHWLKLQYSHKLTLAHYIVYAVLRGKDWRKCFTPVTNEIKIINGTSPNASLRQAKFDLKYKLSVFNDFEPLVSAEECAKLVRTFLSDDSDNAYNIEALLEIVEKQ